MANLIASLPTWFLAVAVMVFGFFAKVLIDEKLKDKRDERQRTHQKDDRLILELHKTSVAVTALQTQIQFLNQFLTDLKAETAKNSKDIAGFHAWKRGQISQD